ncbi:MAG: hypothetical protein ACT4PT_01885 [Methanobacteriota archaeon]
MFRGVVRVAAEAGVPVRRFFARQRPLAVLCLGLGLITGAAAASGLGGRFDGRISDGTLVGFHLDLRAADGSLLYTTDSELAAEAIAAGNERLNPNLTSRTYGLRHRIVDLDREDAEFMGFEQFLLGRRAGETARTPLVDQPLGPVEEYTIPRTLGPVSPYFALGLDRVRNHPEEYADVDPTQEFEVGTRLPYAGFLEAEVVAVDNDTALLRMDAGDGHRFLSGSLGFNLTTERTQDGQMTFHPDVEVGDVFVTRGCRLPLETIEPGRYRVVHVGDTGILVSPAPTYIEGLFGRPLRAEFRIQEVSEFPEALVAAATAGQMLRLVQARISS